MRTARSSVSRSSRSTPATSCPPSTPGRADGARAGRADQGRRGLQSSGAGRRVRRMSMSPKAARSFAAARGFGRSRSRPSRARPIASCGSPGRPMKKPPKGAVPGRLCASAARTEAEWVKQLVSEQLVTVKTKRGFQPPRMAEAARTQRGARLPCLCSCGGVDRRCRPLDRSHVAQPRTAGRPTGDWKMNMQRSRTPSPPVSRASYDAPGPRSRRVFRSSYMS